jgi:hypothetical protein
VAPVIYGNRGNNVFGGGRYQPLVGFLAVGLEGHSANIGAEGGERLLVHVQGGGRRGDFELVQHRIEREEVSEWSGCN